MSSSHRLPQVLIAFVLLISCLQIGSLQAHELRPAIADISRTETSVTFSLQLNLEALISETGPEHSDSDDAPTAQRYNELRELSSEALENEFRDYLPEFLSRFHVEAISPNAEAGASADSTASNESLQLRELSIPPVGDTSLPRDSRIVLYMAMDPESAIRWSWDAVYGPVVIRAGGTPEPGAAPPTATTTVTDSDDTGDIGNNGDDLAIKPSGEDTQSFNQYLQAGDTSDPIPPSGTPGSSGSGFLDYIVIGFEHIIPKGLDHILFVIGLFLLAPKLKPIVWQVSMFTIAHSITLALGITGLVVLSPAIVEPLIALSITVICVENLFGDRFRKLRLAIVFAFGLLHGLGFAGVLSEIGLTTERFVSSLLAFNIGVELGQLSVVLLCFALVGWWFGNKSWYRQVIVIPVSLGIGAVGLYWFLQRTGLI